MTSPGHEQTPRVEALSLAERIRRRAYQLYDRRGRQPGSLLDEWLQAEEEILRAHNA